MAVVVVDDDGGGGVAVAVDAPPPLLPLLRLRGAGSGMHLPASAGRLEAVRIRRTRPIAAGAAVAGALAEATAESAAV